MILAKDLLIHLSFHAKIHNILNNFDAGITTKEKTHYQELRNNDETTTITNRINKLLELVDKKTLKYPKKKDYFKNIKDELTKIKENIINI